MKSIKSICRIIAIAAIGLFVCVQSSCVYYQRYPLITSRLTKIKTEGLSFYLLDEANPRSRGWYISSYKFQENSMDCYITKMTESETKEVMVVRGRRNAKASKDEVLLFGDPQFTFSMQDTGLIHIPFDRLNKVEVYEANQGKTLTTSVGSLAILVLLFGGFSDY